MSLGPKAQVRASRVGIAGQEDDVGDCQDAESLGSPEVEDLEDSPKHPMTLL